MGCPIILEVTVNSWYLAFQTDTKTVDAGKFLQHPVNSGPSKGANLFEQQSTVRDALLAALTLNIFNDKADIVKMANGEM